MTVFQDFAADVLERLRRDRCTLHGCPPCDVIAYLDGSVRVMFAGFRPDHKQLWRGGIQMRLPFLEQRHIFGDPEAVSQTVQKIIKQDMAA